jgi:hypothetical protein
VYSNQKGCDGERVYYDGCAMIALNGAILQQVAPRISHTLFPPLPSLPCRRPPPPPSLSPFPSPSPRFPLIWYYRLHFHID